MAASHQVFAPPPAVNARTVSVARPKPSMVPGLDVLGSHAATRALGVLSLRNERRRSTHRLHAARPHMRCSPPRPRSRCSAVRCGPLRARRAGCRRVAPRADPKRGAVLIATRVQLFDPRNAEEHPRLAATHERPAISKKAVAVLSAATGPLGGARAQYEMRKVLQFLMRWYFPSQRYLSDRRRRSLIRRAPVSTCRRANS